MDARGAIRVGGIEEVIGRNQGREVEGSTDLALAAVGSERYFFSSVASSTSTA